ncbi:MAG: 30S ribosomal protein S20 [Candidatus Levybacteria bacterium]|nr:30S ribosomal protein S20 [Candidatus Levybacteria bacterium]
MPVTKSAQKKLRQDKKRQITNKTLRETLKKSLKKTIKNPDLKKISEATRVIDKAVKKSLIHKNKAARLKSRLSKLVKTSPKPVKKEKKPAKKASK